MTKTDFAELKEKLTGFSGGYNPQDFAHDSAIISELIDIIKLQSEALEFYSDRKNWADYPATAHPDADMMYCMDYKFDEKSNKVLSETTTRLQKLRDGK